MSGNLSFTGSAPTIQSNNPINIQAPNLTLNGQPVGSNEFKLVLDKGVFTATRDGDTGNFHIPGLSQYNDFLFVLKTTDTWQSNNVQQTLRLTFFGSGYVDPAIWAMSHKTSPIYKHRTFVSRMSILYNSSEPSGNLIYLTDYRKIVSDGDSHPVITVAGTTYNQSMQDYLYWYADELNQTVTFNVWLYAKKI